MILDRAVVSYCKMTDMVNVTLLKSTESISCLLTAELVIPPAEFCAEYLKNPISNLNIQASLL